jgi:hypothetical protein
MVTMLMEMDVILNARLKEDTSAREEIILELIHAQRFAVIQ